MDDLDLVEERLQRENDTLISDVRKQATRIPAGEPGECQICGEFSKRLVRGNCAPCRDEHKLP